VGRLAPGRTVRRNCKEGGQDQGQCTWKSKHRGRKSDVMQGGGWVGVGAVSVGDCGISYIGGFELQGK